MVSLKLLPFSFSQCQTCTEEDAPWGRSRGSICGSGGRGRRGSGRAGRSGCSRWWAPGRGSTWSCRSGRTCGCIPPIWPGRCRIWRISWHAPPSCAPRCRRKGADSRKAAGLGGCVCINPENSFRFVLQPLQNQRNVWKSKLGSAFSLLTSDEASVRLFFTGLSELNNSKFSLRSGFFQGLVNVWSGDFTNKRMPFNNFQYKSPVCLFLIIRSPIVCGRMDHLDLNAVVIPAGTITALICSPSCFLHLSAPGSKIL